VLKHEYYTDHWCRRSRNGVWVFFRRQSEDVSDVDVIYSPEPWTESVHMTTLSLAGVKLLLVWVIHHKPTFKWPKNTNIPLRANQQKFANFILKNVFTHKANNWSSWSFISSIHFKNVDVYCTNSNISIYNIYNDFISRCTLLEEKVLYRTLKGSISPTTYLEPLKGSIQKPSGLFVTRKKVLYGTFWVHSLSFVLSFPD